MKLLILSVSIGNGHLKVAEAIREYAENNYSDIEVKEVDYLKYISPVVDKVIVKSYLSTLKMLPMLYGKLYNESKEENMKKVIEIFNKVSISKTKELVDEFTPDVIVCTHPFPLESVSVLKEKRLMDTPTVGVITDYTVHPKWLYKNTDAYVVPNEDFIVGMKQDGISDECIYPYGIPIGESFFNVTQENKNSLRKELGISKNKSTVLIMSGGCGIGNVEEVFEELIESSTDYQIIVCCGNNRKLVSKLTKIHTKKNSSKNAVILGYTSNINVLMSISDILISKPGGITVTEAMHMKLPLIISSMIPGQEEENADYLINGGIAMKMKLGNINGLLNQTIFNKNTKRIQYIKDMQLEKINRNSNKNICDLLIKLGGNNEIEKKVK